MHFEHGEIDLLDPAIHDDPWELYTWLREEAPLYRDRNGLWYVSRYDDIVKVSKDPDTFTSLEGNRPGLPADHSFIHLEGDAHRKRRDLIAEWFGAKAIARLEGHIRDVVTELIDAVIESGRSEFVADISAPLPALITCEMTGIPAERAEEVRALLDVFIRGGNGPDHVTEEVNDAFFQFGLIHMDLVEEHRVRPRDDLLQVWMDARIDGEPMNEDQLLFEHTMLMVGGSETTRNAISCGVLELARRPEQRAWLVANPDGLPNAVEEIIRWATPFISMSRTATRDVRWGEHTIAAGDGVVMLYPPANRDPRKFTDPETFDVRRTFQKGQLAFGYGRHFCLGARLARSEALVMLQELLRRIPDWRIDGTPTFTSSSMIRGPATLPLAFTPGPRSLRASA